MKNAFVRGASAAVAATSGRRPPRGPALLRALFTLVTGFVLAAGASPAFAGANVFRGNNMSAPQGGTDTLTVNYIPDGTTTRYTVDIVFDGSKLTPTAIGVSAPSDCFQLDANTVRVLRNDFGNPQSSEFTICTIDFRANPAAPATTVPIQFANPTCTDDSMIDTGCTVLGSYSFTIATANPGPSCPVIEFNGDNQSDTVGATLQPMQAKQPFFSSTQPPSETFNWQIVSGDAVFTSTNGTTASNTSTYTNFGGNLWDAFGSQTLRLGTTPGTIMVEVQSASCTPSGNPATFTATSFAAPTPTMVIHAGDGQVAQMGATFDPFVVELNDGVGPAQGVTVRFDISGGDALFTDGSSTFFAQTDVNGRASATAIAGSNAGPVVVDASATGYPSVQFGATIVNPPSMIIVSGDGQSGPPDATLAPMVVRLDTGSGPAGDTNVTFTILSGDATFAENGATSRTIATNGSGEAQSTLTLGATDGPIVVEVTATGYPTLQFGATLATPAPTMTKVSGDNQSGVDGATLAPMVVLLDDGTTGGGPARLPEPGVTVTYTVLSGDAVIVESMSSTHSTTSDGSGNAQASLQLGPTAGPISVEVSAPGYNTVTFDAFNVTATPTMTKISGNDQVGSDGETLDPMVVLLDDGTSISVRQPEPGVSVTYTVVQGDAVIAENGASSYTTTTDGSGNAQASLTLGNTPGGVLIDVSAPGYNTVTFNAANGGVVFNGDVVIVSGNNQSTTPTRTFASPLVVELQPAPGADCSTPSNEPVDFTISGPAKFAANNSTSITVLSDGATRASVTVVADNGTGPVSVTASSSTRSCGTFRPATFSLEVRPVSRELVKVSGDGQVGFPGAAGQPLVVQALESGDPIQGLLVTWRVAAVIRGSGVTLSGTQSSTDAEGKASIGFTFGAEPTEVLIEAREPSGITATFVVSSSRDGRLVLVSGGQNGAAGSTDTTQLVFRLENTSGTPLAGQTVTFSVAQGSATVTPATGTTDSSGLVTTTLQFGSTPGTVIVRASAFSGSVTLDSTFTAFAATLSIVSGNNQSGAPGTRLPQPFVVQIGQPANKALGGVPVTWTVVTGGGTLTSTTTTTDSSGRSSNDYTLGSQAGANRVQASVPGGATVVFESTATGGSGPGGLAQRVEIVSGNNQTLATGETSAALLVRALTENNVRVSGLCLTWTGSNGVVLSSTQTTTNTLGESSVTAVLNQPGPATVTVTTPCASNVQPVTFTLNGAIANIDNLDPVQTQIAEAFDSACPALSARSASGQALSSTEQDLLAQCALISSNAGSNPGAVVEIIDQILADEAAAQNQAALDASAAQFNNLKARLAALRSGQRTNWNGLALAGDNGVLPLSFLPSNIIQGEDEEGGGGTEAGADFSRWGFFASGTIGRGDRDAGQSSPGFDFDTYGLTAGVDYRYSDSLIFGLALGYSDVDTDLDGDQGGLQTSGYTLSGYTTFYKGDAWYTDAVVTLGRNEYDLSRRIRYQLGNTRVDQIATASPDGSQTALALSFGRDFNRGAWSFGPFARGTYTKIDFDTYTERLSNPNAPGSGLAMTVEGRDLKSLEAVLGGKASYTMSTSWGILIPHVQLEWLHELEDDPENVITRLASDPTGTPIVIPGEDIDSNYFNLGFGLSGVFANGRSAFLYYEHRAGQSDFKSSSLAIGVRIEF